MTSTASVNLTKLGHILADELALAGELESVMNEKQHALVTHQLTLLEPLSQREQSAAQRLAQVDAERCALSLEMAALLGLPQGGLKLSHLAAALEGGASEREREQREWLFVLASSLSCKLATLSRLNDENRMLTNNLLDYTGMVMRLLSQGHGGQNYGRSGRPAEMQPARVMLDDRI